MNPCIAVSAEADFEAGTWTFEPIENFVICAGRYSIMREAEYEALMQQRDELLEALKGIERHCPCDPDINVEWFSAWTIMRMVIATTERSKEAA